MKKTNWFLVSLLVILAMLLVACGGSEEEPAEEAATTSEEAVAEEAEAPAEEEAMEEEAAEEDAPAAESSGDGERTEVRWFVGLGAGTDLPVIEAQEEIVAEFNASQDEIELVLEVVDADQAYGALATQIAAGNAPDIVGPVGIRGRDFFRGAWVDLQPFIDAETYDLSDFDPNLVQFYVDEGAQLGLPFAIFPSFLSYNMELFDEGGVPYPPSEYGAPYTNIDGEEVPWDIDAMREVALLLTVDGNGNDALSPDFDPNDIVQFGYYGQWFDFRAQATLFGPGSLVDEDGNAQVPDNWRDAAEWFYDGWWNDVFMPNSVYEGSDIIAGNGWESGNVAMVQTHLWLYGCCVGNVDFDYGLAAMPANEFMDGPTAKMHADTFGLLKGGDNQDAAWEVLKYFIGERAADMTSIYGGMPARLSLQDDFFETFATTVPNGENVNWQVVIDSMAYADNPNHEGYMPSPQEANDRYNEFWTLLGTEAGRDVQADIDLLVTDLQAIYDAAGNE
jgi:multiple sugar transport system substrate-binding protein